MWPQVAPHLWIQDAHYVFMKKTPTHVFDYNSGVSLSIYIVFVLIEREMNTLQHTYLQSHACHKSLLHKSYFLTLYCIEF